ncbi:DUF6465 family protein [Kineothrix sedimenti]|uniref:DUF6465 family protein n=1 Tax=Kineothrix sedimenti TaxID=3123317 RepID=A0ABZ3EWF8_9FIRM
MTETKKTSTVKSTVSADTTGTAAKKEAAKPAAKKTPAKKETKAAKKTTAKGSAKNTDVKQVISLQFGGKSYSMEDLTKIAEDVWKYDLHKSDEAYKSLELYVKPEESIAYYVFNGDISGNFFI